ncbi:hypothetical protein [Nocardiopsis sp. MG754419]|uniref:hypothetical protein n=1 Tax=Nocardiopsis sp. MG754419 TaxID=2259865 RepID=UPI001BA8232C|nr:hypothetical protein [Nocardiopsis sp. MG754419]MBR8741102.1 hypothetical protein [Nocardiopsis sp. MG754419]
MPPVQPDPTEVIEAWIPHDARWHSRAREQAGRGSEHLRVYVTELVRDHRDGTSPVSDDFDLRTLKAVVEDLGAGGLGDVDWRRVARALSHPGIR